MSGFVEHEPCECGSSDGLARYEDGTGYCWVCKKYAPAETADENNARPIQSTVEDDPQVTDLLGGEYTHLPKRHIDVKTCRKFGYTVDGPYQIATYRDAAGNPVAQKVRTAGKKFSWRGDPKSALLFGQHLWNGGRRLVVTEGEIDCLSVAQAFGLRWAVVSIPNGAPGARKDLAKHIEFLESYDTVVFMFDDDEPGRKAAVECAELLTPGKAAIATLPEHDANDMLVAGRIKELVSASWEAKPFRPDGIVLGETLWKVVSTEPEHGLSYPWPCLDLMMYGQRQREVVTWTGGTGTGKSSLLREVAFGLVKTHGKKVGIIALEESVKHAALCQMSLSLERQLHLPDVRERTPEADLKQAFEATMASKQYVFYDHFGTVEASALLPKIRYMIQALDVEYVILDHVSIMVSGMATEGDERKRIDELMTKLRSLVEELNFGLHIISHLRKAGGTPHEEGGRVSLVDLRGSGAIGQVSDLVVAAERNQQDANGDRNRMRLRVLKNRFSGETGIAGDLTWDSKTGRLVETARASLGEERIGDF